LGCVKRVSFNEYSAFCFARRVYGTLLSANSCNFRSCLPLWQKGNVFCVADCCLRTVRRRSLTAQIGLGRKRHPTRPPRPIITIANVKIERGKMHSPMFVGSHSRDGIGQLLCRLCLASWLLMQRCNCRASLKFRRILGRFRFLSISK
jgi:hypothetical protein